MPNHMIQHMGPKEARRNAPPMESNAQTLVRRGSSGMAGVPVRLNGTHACRKPRRTSCLHQTPECRICRAAERSKGAANGTRRATGRTTAAQLRARRASSPDAANGAAAADSDDGDASSTSDTTPTPSPRRITTGLAQQQVIQAYMSTQPAESETSAHLNWLVETKGVPLMTKVLHVSTLAFCAVKIGRASDRAGVIQASRQWYAMGLRELQKALWDPKQMYKDDTLAACVLLALYEVAECPAQSRKGYKSHHDGCAMLVKSRGPEAHAEGLGRAVFSTFRMMGATEGLIVRHTFLAEEKWMDIPFRKRPKTHYDKLVDLIIEIPGILAMVDEVLSRETSEQQIIGGLEMLSSTLDLASRFCNFYTELDSALGPLYWTRTKNDDIVPGEESPFPNQNVFPSIEMASMLLYYWSCRALILSVLCALHRNLVPYETIIMSNPEAKQIGTEQSPHWTEIFDMPVSDSLLAVKFAVRNVCQSVEYCLQQSAKWAGGTAVMAPLRIVIDTVGFWPEFEEETKYILRSLERLHDQGLAIVPYLSQVATAYRKEEEQPAAEIEEK